MIDIEMLLGQIALIFLGTSAMLAWHVTTITGAISALLGISLILLIRYLIRQVNYLSQKRSNIILISITSIGYTALGIWIIHAANVVYLVCRGTIFPYNIKMVHGSIVIMIIGLIFIAVSIYENIKIHGLIKGAVVGIVLMIVMVIGLLLHVYFGLFLLYIVK